MWSLIAKILGFLLLATMVNGQHFPMHTQTTNHLQLNNPAYAGFSGKINGLILSRLQWTQVDGAPTTTFLNLDGALVNKSMGWGFSILNDEIGPLNTLQVMGSYSYRIKAFNGELSFGLQAGAINQNNNWSAIETIEENDPAFANDVSSQLLPQVGFGMYWQNRRLSIGLGAPWLLK
ncbi:MAG: PorP/SprF family type IX secretion system membrane protein, partial [Bacteroidia bacterium]